MGEYVNENNNINIETRGELPERGINDHFIKLISNIIAHEVMHKVLYQYVSSNACDSLDYRRVKKWIRPY